MLEANAQPPGLIPAASTAAEIARLVWGPDPGCSGCARPPSRAPSRSRSSRRQGGWPTKRTTHRGGRRARDEATPPGSAGNTVLVGRARTGFSDVRAPGDPGGLVLMGLDTGTLEMTFGLGGGPEPSPADDASLMREPGADDGAPAASLLGMISGSIGGGTTWPTNRRRQSGPDRLLRAAVAGAISGVKQFFTAMLEAKSDPHAWRRLDDARVITDAGTTSKAEEVAKGDNYFVIRLKEMYVRDARKLWQTYYPVLHSFVQHRKPTEVGVVGPGQLSALRQCGGRTDRQPEPAACRPDPVPRRRRQPRRGALRRARERRGAGLDRHGGRAHQARSHRAGGGPKVANAIKGGIERTLGLKDQVPGRGSRTRSPPGKPLRTGVYVGIASSDAATAFSINSGSRAAGSGSGRQGSAVRPV